MPPDDPAVFSRLFLPLVARLVEIGCKSGFLLWSAQTPEAFLKPLHQFRGFKHVSKSFPIGASINHTLNLKHVIGNHISVGVKHMLKFCPVLNGYFLELEPTFFFVQSIFAPPHTFTANYSAIPTCLSEYIALWLLHKKPN